MNNESRIKTGYPHLDKPWLQFYDEKLKSMHRSLIGLSASLSNLGNSQKEISQYYKRNW